jgi:hypothetical protein
MGKEVYPTTISGRTVYYVAAVPYVNTNAIRLLVAPDKLTVLVQLYDTPGTDISKIGYFQLMVLYSDKSTCTTPVKNERRKRDKALQQALSSIYNDIPGSVWTSNDRAVLGRKGPVIGHKPETTSTERTDDIQAPDADLEPLGKLSLMLRIKAAGKDKGVSKKRGGKDKKVLEYIFHYIIHAVNTAYPTDINACTEHVVITRLPKRFYFQASQAGMRCSGFIQVILKPSKTGANGPLITAIIPG